MDLTDLESWRTYCRTAATVGEPDGAVLASDWASAGITPPPGRGEPRARIPLERAGELETRAGDLEGSERSALLEEALAWLDSPHPRTPPELRAAMRRRRDRIERALGG